jgi:hypothetical protein
MKAVRVLLVVAGAVVLLGLIALAVGLNSSFQTWAARKALATRTDVRGAIGSVSAGFRHVELRDLRFESHGAVLTLPKVDAEVPIASAAMSQKVTVRSLVAKGWTLDLTKAAPVAEMIESISAAHYVRARRPRAEFSLIASAYAADPAAASPALTPAFRGVFAELHLPVDLSLDGVDLAGEVILPSRGPEPAPRIKVNVRGGALAAGREGSFAVDLAAAKLDGGALTLHSTVTAQMDTPRTFTRVGAKATAAASGTQMPNGVTLDIEGSAARAAAGEDYFLQLASAGKTLGELKAAFSSATAHIAGTWRIDLHDSDLSPFALGRSLPVFAADGSGQLDTGGAFEEIHVTGALNASASRLEAVRPELSAVGGIHLKADFDLLQHGQSVRVERLTAAISGAAPVATVHALQPFEFNFTTAELRVADPAQDLIGVVLQGVPVAWAQPLLGGLELSGGALQGEFAGSARGGGLALRAKTPLTIRGLSLSEKGQPLLRELDLALTTSADYTPQGWQAQVEQFTIKHGGATLLSTEAKAGRLAGANQPLKVTGRWNADLVGWVAQPAVADELQLAGGVAQGEFSASVDGTKAVETKVTLSNLVAATKEKLPLVRTELRADMAPDGRLTFNAPIWFERAGRTSDLSFTGTLTPVQEALALDARLTSDLVVVEDVQLLALLVPASSAQPTEKKAGRETAPFWGEVNGQVALALKRIVYGGSLEATDVGGSVRIAPDALTLDGVRALFGPESDLQVGGGVSFDANAKDAYALAADMALTNFDTGPMFHALDPAKLPTVEARVNLNTHVTGAGANLGQAIERAHGAMQLTGKSGVFRALSADLSGKVEKTQSTVAAIGGLIGAVTGKQEYADYANKTQILTDIAKALAEIPFDQLNVTAARDEQLNLQLKDFTLISPEVRLTGGGEIRYVEGTPLLAQPLQVELNLGARGRLADLLKRAGLLEAKQDNLGYAAFVSPIRIGGTLANTDTSELAKALLNSALQKNGLIDNLFGK